MRVIEYNRITLFEEVWNEPMTKVAGKYGVSNQDIKVQLEKLNVPTPSPGYWLQLRLGKVIDKPCLPEYTGADTSVVSYDDGFFNRIRKLNKKMDFSHFRSCDYINNDIEEYCSILVVPDKLENPHLLIQEILAKKKLEKKKFRRSYIKTSDEQFGRALIILDTILKTVEQWEGTIKITESAINVIIEKVEVKFEINENTKRIEHIKTAKELLDAEKGRYSWIPEYDYVYSGELTLFIDTWHAPRQKWNDTPKRKIESIIGEIIGVIFITADNIKKFNEYHDKQERIREEKRIAKYELQKLKEHELNKTSELEEKAQDHKSAKIIREFIEEMIRSNLAANNEEKQSLQAYIAWAKEKADWLDPLTAGEDRIFGYKHADWLNKIFASENDS
ncbi:hypothetical protein [Paenibacillus antarcticus]|uniref:Uncharacterized protein n=1 Tax=Paenibacillus antarcticus TaxID=253703 RepID=A0A168P9A4_9BACL|nr:hypothetical protein [Paenibacillus antarcticus]OAB46525.1 hypothetical protein PBAT_10930 [Paenibacillus antarcticus]